MKQRTLKELDAILNSDIDIAKERADADKFFATLINPPSFTGDDNYEVRYDKDFEQNCIILAEYTRQPVKTLTVKEYFTLVQYYNRKHKK
jgi:hypothetical protein